MKHLIISRRRLMYGRKKNAEKIKSGKKRKRNHVSTNSVSASILEESSPSGVPALVAGVPKIVKVVVAGDQGTGKSSFIFIAKYHNIPVNLPSTVELIDTAASCEQELDENLKQADAVVLTHACNVSSTLDNIQTLWLPRLRKLQVKVPVIVVGCKLDLLDEQHKFKLKHLTSDVMKQNPRIEICIECSAKENIGIHKVLAFSRIAAVYPSAPLFDQNRMLKPRCMSALRRIFRLLVTDEVDCLSNKDMDYFQDRFLNTHLDRSEMNDLKNEVKEISSDYVNDRGLTLNGFYCYYAQFREKGRLDLAWKVLKKFGYNDDIKFDFKFEANYFLPIMEECLDKNVELTNEAVEFLKETFSMYDTDGDETLKTSELEDIFSSVPESPWSKAPYVDAAELGGLSIDGFLSEWALMTVQDPVHSAMNLMYIGYEKAFSAFHFTQRSCIDRERNQSDRNVFQCFVFGPKEAGKSALVNTLIGRPFSDSYIPTKEERYAVNIVDKPGVNKTLIMREIPEEASKHLLSNKDALAACDIAVFVYDSSSEPSWKRTAKLLQKVDSHGYKGPFLIVATKVDLDLHLKALEDSNKASRDMGIDAPILISTKKGDYNDVFKKIIVAAEHPHLNIPDKNCHQLANRPLLFESGAFMKNHVEIKEYVWMTLSDVKNSPQRVGGALCIDPSGILITTVIATCQSPEFCLNKKPRKNQTSFKSNIPTYVQAMKGGQVWRARLVHMFENCGVLFYQIITNDTLARFPFINLETIGNFRLEKESRLYGYIHEGGPSLDFSYVRGLNNFHIPPDVAFWRCKTMNTTTVDERDELFNRSIHQNAPYRTIGGVVDKDIHEGVLCIPVEASSMFCDLPLLQVTGLGLETYRGQSGCPVFKCEGDDLLGLILFTKGYYTFILPVNVLRYCVNILYTDYKIEKK